MSTVKMKTNIMCGSCIQKVTPVMNENFGEGNWKVEITNPKKILTVTSENASQEKIKKALEKVGYKAEELV
ncbi:MAG: heavy metal transport/detoxification protein [Chitinophagaceae bacterium]|nr:heavy metal transport/detoxification protein [Chitinophagaceae bacterium]